MIIVSLTMFSTPSGFNNKKLETFHLRIETVHVSCSDPSTFITRWINSRLHCSQITNKSTSTFSFSFSIFFLSFSSLVDFLCGGKKQNRSAFSLAKEEEEGILKKRKERSKKESKEEVRKYHILFVF